MQNLGIKSKVVLLGSLPAILFFIVLAGYAIATVFPMLDDAYFERGHMIAAQLAPAAENDLILEDAERLQTLVQQLLAIEHQLRAVVITDTDGDVLASGGQPIEPTLLNQMVTTHTKSLINSDSVIFLSPIIMRGEKADVVIGYAYVDLSKDRLQVLEHELLRNMLLLGLFGLLFSSWVAWLIIRNITKSIQEIAFAIDKVGDGDFSHVIAENSSGELKVLQAGFNSMSQRLKKAYAYMQERVDDATAQLRYQTQHDDLTGLINRREFEERLSSYLLEANQLDKQHICCYLDLDQFKLVNDTCGHVAGDELLRQMSALFVTRIGASDTLARLDGNEFGLLFTQKTLADVNVIINQLFKLVRDYRYVHEERVFKIGISVGIVKIDSSFDTASDIMHAADAACHSAKMAGRNQSFLYNHADSANLQRHNAVHAISGITDKIHDDSFVLYCQPIVSLALDAPHQQHYEVLIRQVSAKGEVSLPKAFIPSAERYNLMQNVDRWVIKHTFLAYRKLLDNNLGKINYLFSINLSGTSLSDSHFLNYIQEQFSIYAIPPRAICFEITETAAIVNVAQTIRLMTTLKKLGCKFALDDFGSGMSSFMYLKKFAVDYLKIDGSFVKEIHLNTIDYATVKSIHSVAQALNIKTVAEYVENDAILHELREIGIGYGQGNRLGMPIELKNLIENLSKVES
jgi:diguanylate cyclase (GGDEF)-like protein